MPNFIPEEKISEIRNTADIGEIISDVVQLKRTGKNYIGLCPFHSEKTPSFTVSPDKQIFHCFGCGTGGNVFTFLMKHDGITFPEAVKMLANRYGVSLPPPQLTPEQKRRVNEKDKILKINHLAAQRYREILVGESSGGPARDYLKRRGLNPDSLDAFQIGYAPQGWENIIRHLNRQQISAEWMWKSGLVLPRKNGNGYYDRFRERIVFPIIDLRDKVIGFGGRVIDDTLPKYLNSPETSVYSKSRSLYGIHHAKSHCREKAEVLVVEGYLDVIALYQHGIRNVVATLGTALTQQHVRMLKGLIGNHGKVILVFDSDDAGLKAAQRSIEVFDKEYVNAQVLVLKSGYDPDTYVFEFGAEAFLGMVSKAMGFIPFLLETALKNFGMTIEGKVKAVSELLPYLYAVSDSVERSLLVHSISERLAVPEKALLERLAEYESRSKRPLSAVGSSKNGARPAPAGDAKGFATGSRPKLESKITSMLLQFPDILDEVRKLGALDHFEDAELKLIGETILESGASPERSEHGEVDKPGSSGRFAAKILDGINDDRLRSRVSFLASQEQEWSYDNCLKLLLHFVESARKERTKRDFDRQIKAAELTNDQQTLEKLLAEKQQKAEQHYRQKQKIASIKKG